MLEQPHCLDGIATAGQMVNRPEIANSKRTFIASEPVVPALISRKQPAPPESLPNAVIGRDDACIVGRLVADSGHQQESGIQRVTIEVADVALDSRIVPPCFDGIRDRLALAAELRRQSAQRERPLFMQLEQT